MYTDAKTVAPNSPAPNFDESSVTPVSAQHFEPTEASVLTQTIEITPNTSEFASPDVPHKAAALAVVAANGNLQIAASPSIIGVATLVIQGPAKALDAQGKERVINNGSEIYLNDTIVTGPRTYVKIQLSDGTVFQLGPLSRATLEHFDFQQAANQQESNSGEFEATVQAGNFRFASGRIAENNEGTHTIIKTPSAVIGIRGSEIDGRVEGDGSTIILHMEGLIDIRPLYSFERFTVFEPGTRIEIPIDPLQQFSAYQAETGYIQGFRNILAPLNQGFEAVYFEDGQGLQGEGAFIEDAPPGTPDFDESPNGERPPTKFDDTPHEGREPPLPEGNRPPHNPLHGESTEHRLSPEGQEPTNPNDPSSSHAPPQNDTGERGLGNPPSADKPPEHPPIKQTPVPPPDGNTPQPSETDVSLSGVEDQSVLINSLPGVENLEELQILTAPKHGRLELQEGNWLYIPEPNFHGFDSFTYQVAGQNVPTTVGLTLAPVNDVPTAPLLEATLLEDGVFEISVQEILANVIDVEDKDPTQFSLHSLQNVPEITRGQVELSRDGDSILFTPQPNYAGETGFTYRVIDSGGTVSEPLLVRLNVQAINDAPLVTNTPLNVQLNAGQSITVNNNALLSNVIDVEGDTLRITQLNFAGQVVSDSVQDNDGNQIIPQFSSDGNVTGFTLLAANGFSGLLTISYTVTDAQGATTQVSMNAQVLADTNNQNNFPIAQDDTFSISATQASSISISSLLANDTDPGNEALSFAGLGSAKNGTVQLDDAENVIFTPNSAFASQGGSFVYQVENTSGANASATVNLTALNNNTNTPPIAVDDAIGALGTSSFIIAASSLLSNDSDAENDALRVVQVSNAVNAVVSLDANGDVLVVPEPTFDSNNPASFIYVIEDTQGEQASATVNIAALNTNTNTPPIAVDDVFSTVGTQNFTITASSLVANDSDAENDALRVVQISNVVNATASLDTNGNVLVAPEPTFDSNNPISFIYVIEDTQGDQSNANVTVITTNSTNSPPTANPDLITVQNTNSLSIPATALLSNDTDPDNDSLLITSVANALNGNVSLNANNTVVFTPDANFISNQGGSFDYVVTDGNNNNSTGTVNITLNNAAPIANADQIDTVGNGSVFIAATTLLSNDTDPENDPLSLTQVGQGINGTVSLDANGDVQFIPNTNFGIQGSGSFVYTVEDSIGNTANAVVTVEDGNQAPQAQDDQFTVNAGSSLVISDAELLANDIDPEGEALNITNVGQAINGQVSFDAISGAITVTPDPSLSLGTVSFAYQVADTQGVTSNANVAVTIQAPAAQANPDSLDVPFNTPIQIPASLLLDNDIGENLLLTAVDDLGNPGLSVSLNNQQIDFYADFSQIQTGSTGFSYTIIDSTGVSLSADVSVKADNVQLGGASSDNLGGSDQVDLMQGKEGNDSLFGQAGNDIINGDEDNDLLDGGPGRDQLFGGTGNDTFRLDLNQGADVIDGGADFDTLSLQGSNQNLNLVSNQALPPNQQLQLKNIERIDLNGNNNALILDFDDVFSINQNNQLFIEGNSSNNITSGDRGWERNPNEVTVGGNTYVQYQYNAANTDTANLFVSTDITNQFIL